MARWTKRICIELSPELHGPPSPPPFGERSHGPDDADADADDYGFLIAPALGNLAAGERVARRRAPHRGSILRRLVTLHLHGVDARDGTKLTGIDEYSLRSNDAHATDLLRTFRDSGVDILFVRGTYAPYVAVIFTAAVGTTIEVVDDATYALLADGRWERLASDELLRRDPLRLRRLAATRAHGWWLHLIWYFAVALFVGGVLRGVTNGVAPYRDTVSTVPLWLIFVVAIPIGWFLATRMQRQLNRWEGLMTELRSIGPRITKLEAGMNDEIDLLRHRPDDESQRKPNEEDSEHYEAEDRSPQ
jgi:hypothetical protein